MFQCTSGDQLAVPYVCSTQRGRSIMFDFSIFFTGPNQLIVSESCVRAFRCRPRTLAARLHSLRPLSLNHRYPPLVPQRVHTSKTTGIHLKASGWGGVERPNPADFCSLYKQMFISVEKRKSCLYFC